MNSLQIKSDGNTPIGIKIKKKCTICKEIEEEIIDMYPCNAEEIPDIILEDHEMWR